MLFEIGNWDSFNFNVLQNIELPVSSSNWVIWVNTSVGLIQDLDTLEVILNQIRLTSV